MKQPAAQREQGSGVANYDFRFAGFFPTAASLRADFISAATLRDSAMIACIADAHVAACVMSRGDTIVAPVKLIFTIDARLPRGKPISDRMVSVFRDFEPTKGWVVSTTPQSKTSR